MNGWDLVFLVLFLLFLAVLVGFTILSALGGV